MKSDMAKYLSNHKELLTERANLDRAQRRMNELETEQVLLGAKLIRSVEPICGSGTKPHIRTFTDGTYTTLCVVWDDKINTGRITVTKNEE